MSTKKNTARQDEGLLSLPPLEDLLPPPGSANNPVDPVARAEAKRLVVDFVGEDASHSAPMTAGGFTIPPPLISKSGTVPFVYGLVYPFIDIETREVQTDEGQIAIAKIKRPRCGGLIYGLKKPRQVPETGMTIWEDYAFSIQLIHRLTGMITPFATYNNKAVEAGFSPEQVMQALRALPSFGRLFYIEEVTAEQLAFYEEALHDPDIQRTLERHRTESLELANEMPQVSNS